MFNRRLGLVVVYFTTEALEWLNSLAEFSQICDLFYGTRAKGGERVSIFCMLIDWDIRYTIK